MSILSKHFGTQFYLHHFGPLIVSQPYGSGSLVGLVATKLHAYYLLEGAG